ncbi:CaiB/BaiF CoA transferase family protein [Chloroflexota bacterium]
MKKQEENESLLGPLRVLDLTDEKGFLCGRVLGDLGADVIKVERPGGDSSRNIGPFYHDNPDPEKSLYWFAFNANKRGITLDIASADGREIFRRLVEHADFVIESFPPGYMDGLGLGYSALSKLNPQVVMVSITPFGQTGPYAGYKTSDIVATAMGGLAYITGQADRAPVRLGGSQAYVNAGIQGALGALTAHYHRGVAGGGQWVDVSIQESVVRTLLNALVYWDLGKRNVRRAAPYRLISGIAWQRLVWRCQDGYVSFSFWGGAVGAPGNRALVEWMDSQGAAPDFLRDIDWQSFDMSTVTQDELDRISEPISRFFEMHTMAELYREALERRIMLYPVQTMKEVAADAQLEARGFWTEVVHPESGSSITYPGAFVKLADSPIRIRCRAPLIGEHNEEIYYRELGMSEADMDNLKKAGVI